MAFTPICVQCAREMRCRKNPAQVVVGVGCAPVMLDDDPNFERAASHASFELTR